MKRRLRQIGRFVPSILLVLVAGFWIRSYFRCDLLNHVRPQTCWQVRSVYGGVRVLRSSAFEPYFKHVNLPAYSSTRADLVTWRAMPWSWRFFGWEYATAGGLVHERLLVAPYWFVALLCAIRPSVQLYQAQRRSQRLQIRRAEGLCIRCGYDMRATPERCPECGGIPQIQNALNERQVANLFQRCAATIQTAQHHRDTGTTIARAKGANTMNRSTPPAATNLRSAAPTSAHGRVTALKKRNFPEQTHGRAAPP